MIFAEESSRPKDRGCLRFKCSSFYELNAVNTLPVHDLGAVNDYILRFKYSSTTGKLRAREGGYLLSATTFRTAPGWGRPNSCVTSRHFATGALFLRPNTKA
jgi:hypothetical protein